MEADLENKLASWNGAQTADYGAICNDLAQLKLNKVPVTSSCAATVRQILPAMAVSQDDVLDFPSPVTFTAVPSIKQNTRPSNNATAGWCREPWLRLNNCFSRPLQSLKHVKPKQKKAVLPRMTGSPVSCLAVSGTGLRQQTSVTETGTGHRLGTELAAHAAAAEACTPGHKKEEFKALRGSTAYAAICKFGQAARWRRQRGFRRDDHPLRWVTSSGVP